MDVIVPHVNTDFDAFASALAVRRLYPGATIALPGSLNRNLRDFYRLHADELDVVEASRVEPDAITRLVMVETFHPGRLGELEAVARRPGVEVLAFDHHATEPPDWLAAENVVLSDDGALTTTLVGILAERGIEPTPLEATVFALGIHEDTGSLTFADVNERDVDALAWCLRHGARQDVVAHALHTPLGEAERGLLDALLEAANPVAAGGVQALVTAVRWPTYVDGISNLAHKILDLTDARALVVLVEMDDRVFAVVRSRVPGVDAGTAAAAVGGGGHAGAASAVFRGSLSDARKRVVRALEASAARAPTARDVMSRPPRFVAPDVSISEAMVLCQRHRQSGLLVGDARALVGLVTREDLDKAMGHGLAHAPVKSVMGPPPRAVSERTSLAELQRALAVEAGGRLPVAGDGEIVGVVTRRDVLEALGQTAPVEVTPRGSLADRLRSLDRRRHVFEGIQAVSEGWEGVYLVGGAVRDVLMGEEAFDLDVAVEGDGIAFGEALARALGGRVVPHEKFGTAIVLLRDGDRVDVATARTEFYDRPAALPHVERASIRQDLFRRDFTMNAMAASLRGDDFGRLVDPFGGGADLEHGLVRVLHNLSFIDDPTRIFRAVRYETRYGFRMDAHTFALARACVEMDLVGELSSSRLGDELRALLDEEDVAAAILRLRELGIDRSIHPRLAADEEAVSLVAEVDAVREGYAPQVPRWRPRLAVLARKLSPPELYDWFERLKLRRRDAELAADAVTVAPLLRARATDADDAAALRAVVAPHDPDGALLALAGVGVPPSCGGRSELVRYFEELRDVRLEISGADLARLGVGESPRVGEILEEVLRRKLNGEIAGRDAELAAAEELVAAGAR